jgi:hypothetical protein
VTDGTFRVYVYANDHNPPHCHISWAGNKEAVIDLLSLALIAGDRVPRAGLALIRSNRQALVDAWNQFNP